MSEAVAPVERGTRSVLLAVDTPRGATTGTTDVATAPNRADLVDALTGMTVAIVGIIVVDRIAGTDSGHTTIGHTTIAGAVAITTTRDTVADTMTDTTAATSGSIGTAVAVQVGVVRWGTMIEEAATKAGAVAMTASRAGSATIAGHATGVALEDLEDPAATAGIGLAAGATTKTARMIMTARMTVTARMTDGLGATVTSALPTWRSTSRCSTPWPALKIQKTRIRLSRGAGRSRFSKQCPLNRYPYASRQNHSPNP